MSELEAGNKAPVFTMIHYDPACPKPLLWAFSPQTLLQENALSLLSAGDGLMENISDKATAQDKAAFRGIAAYSQMANRFLEYPATVEQERVKLEAIGFYGVLLYFVEKMKSAYPATPEGDLVLRQMRYWEGRAKEFSAGQSFRP